jgi:hypothetical protein
LEEVAYSGAIIFLQLLTRECTIVVSNDPFFSDEELLGFGFDGDEELTGIDGLIIHTSHFKYQLFDYSGFRNLRFFFDDRNAFPSLSS